MDMYKLGFMIGMGKWAAVDTSAPIKKKKKKKSPATPASKPPKAAPTQDKKPTLPGAMPKLMPPVKPQKKQWAKKTAQALKTNLASTPKVIDMNKYKEQGSLGGALGQGFSDPEPEPPTDPATGTPQQGLMGAGATNMLQQATQAQQVPLAKQSG